jgi:ABC-type nitrate/sulfonate/bicarbonate transport system permease component
MWYAVYGFAAGVIVGILLAVVVIWNIGRILEARHDRQIEEQEY